MKVFEKIKFFSSIPLHNVLKTLEYVGFLANKRYFA
jgi:hypothetical protein